MVDLHGQHAHQSLLSTATQRAALDEFGAIDLGPLRAARARLTEIDAELAALGGDERARAREIDLLRFQVDELDAAGIDDPDEDERLDAEESVLADAAAHREAAVAAARCRSATTGERATRSAAALAALDGRAPFDGPRPIACATCSPSSTTSSPSSATDASRSTRRPSGSPRSASAASCSWISAASTATTSPP